MKVLTYPDCYLHVTECRSGQTWIVEIRPRQTLSLDRRVKEWIKGEFCGECRLDGDLVPNLDGDYYAMIKTDGEPPESARCWTGGGFYIKEA